MNVATVVKRLVGGHDLFECEQYCQWQWRGLRPACTLVGGLGLGLARRRLLRCALKGKVGVEKPILSDLPCELQKAKCL